MSEPVTGPAGQAPPPRRPLLERIGMAGIALVMGSVFVAMAAFSVAGGEPFLALMAAGGAALTAWAGLRTLFRG